MKIRFEEFRFYADPFVQTTTSRLKIMIDRIARGYYAAVEGNIMLENTNVLLVYIYNENNGKVINEKLVYSEGKPKDYIGSFRFLISEEKLLSNSDFEKRIYVLEELHKALTLFLIKFNYNDEIQLFENAKDKFIKEFEFWGRYTKGYVSSDKQYECWLEARECWGFAEHRIGFKNRIIEKISYHFIDNMTYPFFDEMTNLTPQNHWNIVLNTPQFFTNIKWVKNTFEFWWGEKKFIFDVSQKEVIRN